MTISSRVLSQNCIRHRISDENPTVFPGRPSPLTPTSSFCPPMASESNQRITRDLTCEKYHCRGNEALGARFARSLEGSSLGGWLEFDLDLSLNLGSAAVDRTHIGRSKHGISQDHNRIQQE
jgi:hypothetical protein